MGDGHVLERSRACLGIYFGGELHDAETSRTTVESDHSARMLISVAPAGLEQMFFDVGIALPEGSTRAPAPTEDDVKKLLAAAPGYGIDIPRLITE